MPRIHSLHHQGLPLHLDLDELAYISIQPNIKISEKTYATPVRILLKHGGVIELDFPVGTAAVFKVSQEAVSLTNSLKQAWIRLPVQEPSTENSEP